MFKIAATWGNTWRPLCKILWQCLWVANVIDARSRLSLCKILFKCLRCFPELDRHQVILQSFVNCCNRSAGFWLATMDTIELYDTRVLFRQGWISEQFGDCLYLVFVPNCNCSAIEDVMAKKTMDNSDRGSVYKLWCTEQMTLKTHNSVYRIHKL